MILMRINPIDDYASLIDRLEKKLKEQEPFMHEET